MIPRLLGKNVSTSQNKLRRYDVISSEMEKSILTEVERIDFPRFPRYFSHLVEKKIDRKKSRISGKDCGKCGRAKEAKHFSILYRKKTSNKISIIYRTFLSLLSCHFVTLIYLTWRIDID